MDYSRIGLARRILERAGVPIPESEEAIRKEASELLKDKDFLGASSIRLGKNYSDFTRTDWKQIIEEFGENAVRSNIAAFAICLRLGLIS